MAANPLAYLNQIDAIKQDKNLTDSEVKYFKSLLKAIHIHLVGDLNTRITNTAINDIVSSSIQLSKRTINGLFGKEKKRFTYPRDGTLNELAIYLGYTSYTDFKQKLAQKTNLPKITNGEINISSFPLKLKERAITKYTNERDFTHINLIGNGQEGFSELEMKDFYMDVSYLPSIELKQKEKLLLKEKESLASKRDFFRMFTQEKYLTESFVSDHKKALVIGNPGVGKTTYARWLCYQWAKEKILKDKILLFIPLKELRFESNQNILINYIILHYGLTQNPHICLENLRKHAKDFKLILDGFDELSRQIQQKLLSDLSEILTISYLLLTRPYALLDNNVVSEAAIEILGYNEVSKTHYLNKIIEQSQKKDKDPKELQKVIKENPILFDLSDNTLMLSYICLLYINVDNPKEIFLRINSIYTLQWEVVNWFREYHKKKDYKNQGRQFDIPLKKAQNIALKMELKKQFVYLKKDVNTQEIYVSDIEDIFQSLNQIGLGRIENFELSIFNRWGGKVFQSISADPPVWDGTMKGRELPTGLYVYTLIITPTESSPLFFNGSIHLIK